MPIPLRAPLPRCSSVTLCAIVLAAGLLLSPRLSAPALAHLAPAVDDNNRYLKISLLADRVRLAYTVFIGEVPGAQTRLRLDGNRNRSIEAAEADRYGDELAALIGPSMRVLLDDQELSVAFTEINVGMGTPEVAAGAFSVDLVTHFCLPPGNSHSLVLYDKSHLPLPGETEIKVEPAPGVHLERSTLGASGRQSQLEFKWIGADSPLASEGLFLEFSAPTELAAATSDCPKLKAAERGDRGGGGARRIITIIGVAIIASSAVTIARRSRRSTS